MADDPTLAGTEPARVLSIRRGEALVTLGTGGAIRAVLAGRLARDSSQRGPCVGDFVLLSLPAGDGPGRIERILAPATLLQRKAAGARSAYQAIAANVDLAIIVGGLPAEDANAHVIRRALNVRRLERYLLATREALVQPVIVINKADLRKDANDQVAQLRGELGAVDILSVSAQTGAGIESLERMLRPGSSSVFMGASGVGKSTLVNRLLGREVQRTEAIREADARGRHTTTDREIFALPSGALVIDTPGMREFGLVGSDEHDVFGAFEEIAHLAQDCRFRDCRHENEPGCAVLAAIEDGRLATERVDHARSLERERRHHRDRHLQGVKQLRKQAEKELSRKIREITREKRRG